MARRSYRCGISWRRGEGQSRISVAARARRLALSLLIAAGLLAAPVAGPVRSAGTAETYLKQAQKIRISAVKGEPARKAAYLRKVSLYKKAIALRPDYYDALVALANTYRKARFLGPRIWESMTLRQSFNRAQDLLERAKKIAPQRYEAYEASRDTYYWPYRFAYNHFLGGYGWYFVTKPNQLVRGPYTREEALKSAFRRLDTAQCWARMGLPDARNAVARTPLEAVDVAFRAQHMLVYQLVSLGRYKEALAAWKKLGGEIKRKIEKLKATKPDIFNNRLKGFDDFRGFDWFEARLKRVALNAKTRDPMYVAILAHLMKPLPKECAFPVGYVGSQKKN